MDGSLIKVWHDKGQWQCLYERAIGRLQGGALSGRLVTNDCPYHNLRWTLRCGATDTAPVLLNISTPTALIRLNFAQNIKVVCQYWRTNNYHIGTRNNKTNEESNPDIGVQKTDRISPPFSPRLYRGGGSFESLMKRVRCGWCQLDRIKWITDNIAAHYMKSNGQVSLKGLLQY